MPAPNPAYSRIKIPALEHLISLQAAADRYTCSRSYLYSLIHRGEVTRYLVAGRVHFDVRELDRAVIRKGRAA